MYTNFLQNLKFLIILTMTMDIGYQLAINQSEQYMTENKL